MAACHFYRSQCPLRGRANFGALNSAKGALRNLAQAMAKEYGRDGVHVGHVVVDGPIGGEKIKKGIPDYAAKLGDEGMISIDGIVDGYVYLYQQPRQAWSFELDVRTSVKNGSTRQEAESYWPPVASLSSVTFAAAYPDSTKAPS